MAALKICNQDDLFQCVNMMKNFILSTEYAQHLDISYATKFAKKHLGSQEGVTIAIQGDDGVLLGMLAAVATQHPFLPVVSTTDLCWWVEPQARNTRWGLELLKAYEYWAVNVKHAKYINLASMNNPRVDSIYERRGYRKTEHVWTKENI